MVNNTRQALLATATFLLLPFTAFAESENPSYLRTSQSTRVLGAKTGAEMIAGNPEGTQSLEATTNVTVLGKSLNALSAYIDPPSEAEGTTYTEAYSFGKRVFSEEFSFNSDGYNQVHIGLPPSEIRVPIVVYPVGPLILEVSGGARFQAELTAMLIPEIGFPIETSTLGVQVMALAQASGFVEAYAKLLLIRGGVGGQIDLVDAHLDLNGRIAFDGSKPIVLISGMMEFLKGRIYAFVDIFGFLSFGWKRVVDEDIYNWHGYCFSIGNTACPAK